MYHENTKYIFVVTIEKQISIINIPETIDMRSIQKISKACKMSKDTTMKRSHVNCFCFNNAWLIYDLYIVNMRLFFSCIYILKIYKM